MELLNNLQRTVKHSSLLAKQVVFAFICMALTLSATTTAHAQVGEYAVKAAFLYKFGFFVEWPGSTFSSPTSPIHLCIVGQDPFGESLGTVVTDAQINGRNVVVRRLQTVGQNPSCHILYAGGSEEQSRAQIIEAVRGSNVLTVSDSRNSKSDKAIINFNIADNRVRFDIDDEAAAQNGLVISSKLMSLALNVKRRASK